MSLFASRVQKDVKVELGPEEYEIVTIRKLSGRSLEKAAEARRMEVINTVKVYGIEMMKLARAEAADRLAEMKGEKPIEAPKPVEVPKPVEPEPELTPEQKAAKLKAMQEARYSDYDRQLVLQAGIVRWTAKERDGSDTPVTPDNIADMDEQASVKLFREILDLSLPPLEDVTGKN